MMLLSIRLLPLVGLLGVASVKAAGQSDCNNSPRPAQAQAAERHARNARSNVHRRDKPALDVLGAVNQTGALKNAVSNQTILVQSVVAETCNKAHPKSEIYRLLNVCNSQVETPIQTIERQCGQVDATTAKVIGPLIAVELATILASLKANTVVIQTCGTDLKPLTADLGVATSNVSSAAYDIVLSLKQTFTSISGLYQSYPIIETTCSGILTNVSTGLSNLVGACGEQIILFDTLFFPLVSPQMQYFNSISNNFAGFIGSFIS